MLFLSENWFENVEKNDVNDLSPLFFVDSLAFNFYRILLRTRVNGFHGSHTWYIHYDGLHVLERHVNEFSCITRACRTLIWSLKAFMLEAKLQTVKCESNWFLNLINRNLYAKVKSKDFCKLKRSWGMPPLCVRSYFVYSWTILSFFFIFPCFGWETWWILL